MEKDQDLANFFAQNKKNKNQKKGKAAAKKAQPVPVVQEQAEEIKQEAPAAPEKQTPVNNDDDASSDEDQIVLNNAKQVKEKKEIAQKPKNESAENEGWRPGGNFGKQAQAVDDAGANDSGAGGSQAAGQGPLKGGRGRAGGINFGQGKFTFKKAQDGGIGDAMNFPSLGESTNKDSAQQAPQAKPQSKAAGPMMFTSDNLASASQKQARKEEVKFESKRFTFTGKANLRSEAEQQTPASNTDYDYSKMRMSAATSGKRPEGEGGQRRERPARQENDGFGSDEDFEVVREKKREPRRQGINEGGDFGFSQGGQPPRFFRGGQDK